MMKHCRVAPPGEMSYALPLHPVLGLLYMAVSLCPMLPLYMVVSPGHSDRRARSRLDPIMSYLWATSQVPRSMLLSSGIRI